LQATASCIQPADSLQALFYFVEPLLILVLVSSHNLEGGNCSNRKQNTLARAYDTNSEGSMQWTHSAHWVGLGPSGSPHDKVRHNCAWSFGKIKPIFFESPPVLEHCNKSIVVLANYLVIRVA